MFESNQINKYHLNTRVVFILLWILKCFVFLVQICAVIQCKTYIIIVILFLFHPNNRLGELMKFLDHHIGWMKWLILWQVKWFTTAFQSFIYLFAGYSGLIWLSYYCTLLSAVLCFIHILPFDVPISAAAVGLEKEGWWTTVLRSGPVRSKKKAVGLQTSERWLLASKQIV